MGSLSLEEFILASKNPESAFYVPNGELKYVQLKGYKNQVPSFNGNYLPFFTRNVDVIKNMDVREDDTFVVSFPKSGTHWVKELCWLIQNNQDYETSKSVSHAIRTPFIDMSHSNNLLKQLPSPRVFMTHFTLDILPEKLNERAKVVYVMRNPKDLVVSLFHFLKHIKSETSYEGTLDDMCDCLDHGQWVYGSWWKHVNQFLQLDNVHIVHYEDLVENPLNETRKLAKYLSKEIDDEKLKTLIDYCSFDNLKKNPSFELKIPGPSNDANGTKQIIEMKLFRKGVIGDWKNHLDEKMSEKLDHMIAKNLKLK